MRGIWREPMTEVDLIIRGGRVVNAGSITEAPIGITGETITQIGGEMTAAQEIDAGGKLVLPGGVDAHVHLSTPPSEREGPRWVDDFTSGSAAALAGGVTTIGNMSFPAPDELPLATLEREGDLARREAIADWFLHPVINEVLPGTLEQIPRLLEGGSSSIKVFMVTSEFDCHARDFVRVIALAGESGLMTMIHCEDDALIGYALRRLVDAGTTGFRYYPEMSAVVTEVVAVQRAVAIAEATGAPVYIVHLSSARALQACVEAQSRGIPVYVETRPLYLHLTVERFEEEESGRYTGQPPLRPAADVEALWAGLQQGVVQTVCSDHAPYSLAAKIDPGHTLENLRAGVENLQLLRPMLYSEGVRTGKLSLDRFVEVTATNAARLFGLYPRKGTIAPGSDADLVIFDPDLTRTVNGPMLKSNADYSVYEGWEITGWPVMTLRRGEIVYRDGEVVGEAGSGRMVRGGPTPRYPALPAY